MSRPSPEEVEDFLRETYDMDAQYQMEETNMGKFIGGYPDAKADPGRRGLAGVPVYVTESASHARQFARKHAARQQVYAIPGSFLAETPQAISDLLEAHGPTIVLVTWAPALVPCYRSGEEEASGERRTTLYKVWARYDDEKPCHNCRAPVTDGRKYCMACYQISGCIG